MTQASLPMSRGRRLLHILRRLGGMVIVGSVASCGTYIFVLDSNRAPPPPLILDLPPAVGSNDLFSHKSLTDRLTQRFPPGSPETELIRELWSEGFRPTTHWSPSERGAAFEPDPRQFNICAPATSITWSTDGSGRLTGVSGGIDPRCS